MNRRELLASAVAFGTNPGDLAPSSVVHPRRRYNVPPTLWYENAEGQKHIPGRDENDPAKIMETFPYQHAQFPCYLRHSCCTKAGPLFSGESGWSEDLALEMASSGDYRLGESILIVANLCERCTNAAAHDYGLKWGYPRYSEQWRRANTCCDHCRAEGFFKDIDPLTMTENAAEKDPTHGR